MTQTASVTLLRRPGLQQFIKFCIIGASSTIIDAGILYALYKVNHWDRNLAQVLSFVVAVTNGYIWNSLWTFRGQGSGKQHEQYIKFTAVNIVGLLLTLIIENSFIFVLHSQFSEHASFVVGKVVAIVVVSVWNFWANKKWTFAEQKALV